MEKLVKLAVLETESSGQDEDGGSIVPTPPEFSSWPSTRKTAITSAIS